MERTHTQFTVSLSSAPGQLRRLVAALALEQVSVTGLSWQAEGEAGILRFVTDKTLGVEKVLKRLGLGVVETPVVTVPVSNKPGELARMLQLLDDAGVEVREMYGSSDKPETCRLLVAVDKPERARTLLRVFAETLVLATR
ncbi:MAG: hypothetical protein KGL53_01610 [Elusimicrobia bacterium]|nr:hypothetical protein [Elusimicrobiota bacterium]